MASQTSGTLNDFVGFASMSSCSRLTILTRLITEFLTHLPVVGFGDFSASHFATEIAFDHFSFQAYVIEEGTTEDTTTW